MLLAFLFFTIPSFSARCFFFSLAPLYTQREAHGCLILFNLSSFLFPFLVRSSPQSSIAPHQARTIQPFWARIFSCCVFFIIFYCLISITRSEWKVLVRLHTSTLVLTRVIVEVKTTYSELISWAELQLSHFELNRPDFSQMHALHYWWSISVALLK